MPPIATLPFISCVKALTGIRSQSGVSARNPPQCIPDLLEISRQCAQWATQDAKSVTEAEDLLALLLHPLTQTAAPQAQNTKAWRKEVNVVRIFESAVVPDETKTNFCKAIATAARLGCQPLHITIRWIDHRLEPHEVPREPSQARHLIPEVTQKIAARNNWLLVVLSEIVLQFSRPEPSSNPSLKPAQGKTSELIPIIPELCQAVLDFAQPTTAMATLPWVVALIRAIATHFPKPMTSKSAHFYTLFVRWANWSTATGALRKELWSTLPVLATLPHFPQPIVTRVAHHALQLLTKHVAHYLAADNGRETTESIVAAWDTTAVLIHPVVPVTPLSEAHQLPPSSDIPSPHLQRFIELGVQAAHHRPEALLWDSVLRSFGAFLTAAPFAMQPAQSTIVQLILFMVNQAGLSMTNNDMPIRPSLLEVALKGLEALLAAWRHRLPPSVLILLISDDSPLWMTPPPALLKCSGASSIVVRWTSILAQFASLAFQSRSLLGDPLDHSGLERRLTAYIAQTLTALPGTLASLVQSEDTWPEPSQANFHARLWQGLVDLAAQGDLMRCPAALHQSLKFRYARAVFCSHRTFFGHLLALQPSISPWQTLIHTLWPLLCARRPLRTEPAHADLDLPTDPHATHSESMAGQLCLKFRFQWMALTHLTVLTAPDLVNACHEPLHQDRLKQCTHFIHQFIAVSWYILGTQSLSFLHGEIWATWLTSYQL
ncbi:hypothetical protein H4R35_007060, partial [Dimargaris xerosporica]